MIAAAAASQNPSTEFTHLMHALTKAAPGAIVPGLSRVQRLLAKLDHPERKLPPVIHVAGTNGKGSVIAFLRAIAEAGGFLVHSFTSPWLRTPTEQIAIAGRSLDARTYERLLAQIEAANDGAPLTTFEAETVAALLAFSQNAADLTLIETGMGGLEDATNVVAAPALTIITPIALDHCEFLGDTIAAIAAQKAGILKAHVPAVIGPQRENAADIIEQTARRVGAAVFRHGTDWFAFEEHGRLIYQDKGGLIDLARPALAGRHQIENAATAIAAIRTLSGLGLPEPAIEQGVSSAHWPARLQPLRTGPIVQALPKGSEIWLDGGHNPHAATAIAAFLAERQRRTPLALTLVAGMRANKDMQSFFAALPSNARFFVTAAPEDTRAAAPQALVSAAKAAGIEAKPVRLDEIPKALAALKEPQRLLICGSLALCGAILANHA